MFRRGLPPCSLLGGHGFRLTVMVSFRDSLFLVVWFVFVSIWFAGGGAVVVVMKADGGGCGLSEVWRRSGLMVLRCLDEEFRFRVFLVWA